MGKRGKRLKNLMKYFGKVGQMHDMTGTDYTMPMYVTKECHKGNVRVFLDGNLTIYGAGRHHGLDQKVIDDTWLVLDLADNFPKPYETEGSIAFPHLNGMLQMNRLALTWRDGSGGPLGREGWDALIEDVRTWAASGPKHLLVCCMGGHGRTGTALAILLALMVGEKEPIKFLRAHYCKEVVESKTQVTYINTITGLKLTDEEKSMVTYSTYTQQGQGVVTYPKTSAGPGGNITGKGGGLGLSWKDATCEVCGGPAVSNICLGCNRTQRHCSCPI